MRELIKTYKRKSALTSAAQPWITEMFSLQHYAHLKILLFKFTDNRWIRYKSTISVYLIRSSVKFVNTCTFSNNY